MCIVGNRLEGGAATAATGGVGVADAESGACEFVCVIDDGALEQWEALGIDKDPGAGGFELVVVRLGLIDAHDVLAARAAAGFDADAEAGGRAGFVVSQECEELGGGGVGEGNHHGKNLAAGCERGK